MGSIISALGGLSSSLCACNQNRMNGGSIFCCISRNVSLNPDGRNRNFREERPQIRAARTSDSSSSDEFKDELTVGTEDTFLRRHHITQVFYINKNIGYFTTDTKGVFTYISDNMSKFIGLPREEILQSISWVGNVKNNCIVYEKWTTKIANKSACVGKMCFTSNKKHYYIIFEFRPIIHDVNYTGVAGIFLNVEKHAWQIFNESDFNG